jgi:small subunit ribosomal protein S1
VILNVNVAERRIALGLKQALGDPWADVAKRYSVGYVVDGPITSLTKFGAFVQLSEGVEGMIHVSEISAEKRIGVPAEVLRVGQVVQAQILAIDLEKRQMRLSMKQLVPTGLDEYLAEHKEGDVVTGRLADESGTRAELGEGIFAACKASSSAPAKQAEATPDKADLSSLSTMLSARWKTGAGAPAKAEPARAGQVRSFRIVKLDAAAKKIEVELP